MSSKCLQTLLGISLSVMSLWVQAADCHSVEDFAREYYQYLNNAQADEALSLWYMPSRGTRKLILNTTPKFEFARIDETVVTYCDARVASVYVNVLTKTIGSSAERWKGSIELVSSGEDWRILSQDLNGYTKKTKKTKKKSRRKKRR